MWGREKPSAADTSWVRKLTVQEEEARRLHDLATWRADNPVRTYVITYGKGTSEEVVAHSYTNPHFSDGRIDFWAYPFEGSRVKIKVFSCLDRVVKSVRLKEPLLDTLNARVE